MQKKVGFGASRRIHHILGYSINSPGIDGTRDVAYFGFGVPPKFFQGTLVASDSSRFHKNVFHRTLVHSFADHKSSGGIYAYFSRPEKEAAQQQQSKCLWQANVWESEQFGH